MISLMMPFNLVGSIYLLLRSWLGILKKRKNILMKIPDNFDDLNKLFESSEEDAPVDFAEFLEEPMPNMVLRLGRSIRRLVKLVNLAKLEHYKEGELDSFIDDFFSTSKKYVSVLKARREEFVAYIQKIDTGGMPEYFIMESLPEVCVAVTQAVDGDADDDDDDFDLNEAQPGE